MYLWRSLPEGQLLAVLRWMSSRRERKAAAKRDTSQTAPASGEAGEKAVTPLR